MQTLYNKILCNYRMKLIVSLKMKPTVCTVFAFMVVITEILPVMFMTVEDECNSG